MTGIATQSPASGPAAPMSMSFLRSFVTRRMPMTAPIVPRPNHGGNGMKYGSDASTPCSRATT